MSRHVIDLYRYLMSCDAKLMPLHCGQMTPPQSCAAMVPKFSSDANGPLITIAAHLEPLRSVEMACDGLIIEKVGEKRAIRQQSRLMRQKVDGQSARIFRSVLAFACNTESSMHLVRNL